MNGGGRSDSASVSLGSGVGVVCGEGGVMEDLTDLARRVRAATDLVEDVLEAVLVFGISIDEMISLVCFDKSSLTGSFLASSVTAAFPVRSSSTSILAMSPLIWITVLSKTYAYISSYPALEPYLTSSLNSPPFPPSSPKPGTIPLSSSKAELIFSLRRRSI